MSRKKKIIIEADGTPVETDEIDQTAGPDEPTANLVPVYWTKHGEERGAFSEHGSHKAGEKVMTAYAHQLCEAGFASLEAPEGEGE